MKDVTPPGDQPNLTTAIVTLVLMTPEQAAEVLGVTTGTLAVWRCVKRYSLPFVKVGSLVRYRREDVEKFIASRTKGVPETTTKRRAAKRQAA